jgi:hypothetical protein
MQHALQLLLLITSGCGSRELKQLSHESVIAMLIEAARLPQAPCKQLALQALSRILSANPEETCERFHSLGGTSLAIQVIRKP